MRRSAVIIFGLLSAFVADAAATAAEIQYSCNYELGAESSAQRRRIGSVVVAIDVNAKTARIDFGKGWFKPMSLVVDGTDVKETSPPSNGDELGYFYFDLNGNSGGFKSESDPHEFFDACMRMGTPPDGQSADQSPPPTPANNPPSGSELAAAAPASPAVKPPSPPPSTAQVEKPSDKAVPKKVAPKPLPQVAQLEVPKAASAAAAPQAPTAAISPPAPTPPADVAETKAPDVRAVAPEVPAAPKQETQETAPAAALAPVPAPAPPAVVSAGPAPSPEDLHGATDYSADKSRRMAEAAMSPPADEAAVPAAAPAPAPGADAPPAAASPVPPAASVEAVPVPSEEHGTTVYFGSESAEKKSVPAAAASVAQIEAPQMAPSPAPPAAPVHEAALESCRDTLGAEARSAKINFENSSFSIEPASQAELRKIAKMMKDCGAVSVEVGGHADNLGDHNWNKKLSLYRANAVVDFLVGEGATGSSLNAVGYGDEQPVATNDTDEGRRSNRRVELRLSTP